VASVPRCSPRSMVWGLQYEEILQFNPPSADQFYPPHVHQRLNQALHILENNAEPMQSFDNLDPSDLPVGQADFDAMRVKRGIRQNIFDRSVRELSGALILLKHNRDGYPRSNIAAVTSITHHHSLSLYQHPYSSRRARRCLLV
jgi:hypothetical protein